MQAAAEKLHSLSRPVPGTLAETYLRGRAITAGLHWPACAFIPPAITARTAKRRARAWPALLGIVTDLAGNLTGLQRTWLARDGSGKAPLADPRRAMGHLLGNAVRFGEPRDIMAAGEGIETVLSLLSLFPALPMAAGLSAAHLSAIAFPPGLRRLYILRDNDVAGDFAEERLARAMRRCGHRGAHPDARGQGSECRSLPRACSTRSRRGCSRNWSRRIAPASTPDARELWPNSRTAAIRVVEAAHGALLSGRPPSRL